MQEKGGTVITNFVTKVIDIVKELPQKIWNSIVSAVTRVATWGNNMLTKPSCLVYFGTTINETILAIRRLWV